MWLLYGQSVHLPTQRPLSLNHDGKPKLIKEEKRKKKLFFNQIIPNFATMMNDFTPWTLFVDAGIVAVLLLIGKWIRVTVKPVQRLFIPPSLIAGFLGLAFGPNGLGWIPLSTHVGTYAGILIAFIFGCLPFSSKGLGDNRANIGRIWFYSQSGMLMQWIFGGFVGLTLLHYGWPRLNEAFGLAMPSGFCGGHGTAAAIGSAFHTLGYDDMLTLAMTSATVGIIAAVVCGLFIVKWATRRGHTTFLSDFAQLPPELRVGLLPEAKRTSMGTSTCSSISIDSLTFNLIIVMAVALGGYGLSQGVTLLLPTLQLPVFSCAFVVGIGVVTLFKKNGVSPTNHQPSERYVHRPVGSLWHCCHQAVRRGSVSGTLVTVVAVGSGRNTALCVSGSPPGDARLLVRKGHLHLGMVHRHHGYGHCFAAGSRSRDAFTLSGRIRRCLPVHCAR